MRQHNKKHQWIKKPFVCCPSIGKLFMHCRRDQGKLLRGHKSPKFFLGTPRIFAARFFSRRPPIAFLSMLPVIIQDRALFRVLQSKITRNPGVVFRPKQGKTRSDFEAGSECNSRVNAQAKPWAQAPYMLPRKMKYAAPIIHRPAHR